MTQKESYKQELHARFTAMSEIERLRLLKQLQLDNDKFWNEYKKYDEMITSSENYTDKQIIAQFDKSRKAYTVWYDVVTMTEVLKEILKI